MIQEIVSKALKYYRHNFKRLWPLYIFGMMGGAGVYSLLPNIDSLSDLFVHVDTSYVIPIILIYTAVFIFLFISFITLIKTISNIYKSHHIGLVESYKVGQELFIPALFTIAIYDFSVQGATVLLIIPGIIMSIYLAFYFFEFVDQNKRGMDALLSSWSIVSGRWWDIFWKLLLVNLYIFIPYFMISVVIGILVSVMIAAVGFTPVSVLMFIIALLIVFVSFILVIMPLSLISSFEVYYYFRNSREHKRNEKVDRDRSLIIRAFAILGIVLFLVEFIGVLQRLF